MIERGMHVTVTRGIFAEYVGLVQDLDESGNVRVAFKFGDRTPIVWIRITDLKVIVFDE